MIMKKHIKENPMTITGVLNVLKEDRATKQTPTTARQSKAEGEHKANSVPKVKTAHHGVSHLVCQM
jgi:hypothetical protein